MAPVNRHEPLNLFGNDTHCYNASNFSRAERSCKMHEAPISKERVDPVIEHSLQKGELISQLAGGRINAVEASKVHAASVPPSKPASPYEQVPTRSKKACGPLSQSQPNPDADTAGIRSGKMDQGKRSYVMAPVHHDRVVIGPTDEHKVQGQDTKERFYEEFCPHAAGKAGGAFVRERVENRRAPAKPALTKSRVFSHTMEVHSSQAVDNTTYRSSSQASPRSPGGPERTCPISVTSHLVNRRNLERYGDLQSPDHSGVPSGASYHSMQRSRSAAAAGVESNRCATTGGYPPSIHNDFRRQKATSPFSPCGEPPRNSGPWDYGSKPAGARSGWDDKKARCMRRVEERPVHDDSVEHVVFNKRMDPSAARNWERQQYAHTKDYAGHSPVRASLRE
eukprot:TRINITY_DN20510_c0_g1_i1.p1 TRINITY_DN20510_c0_g1~~TRINITY_DN20510_c0_g1_i1.p1  ORF type:complete len:394 (-),score=64.89 TRINITY_DN20510_c0_g1_i1:210-1391(-)